MVSISGKGCTGTKKHYADRVLSHRRRELTFIKAQQVANMLSDGRLWRPLARPDDDGGAKPRDASRAGSLE